MHPHDQAIADFQLLEPQRYTSFVRLDLRQQYSEDIDKPETLLQLWFHAEGFEEIAKPFLHLICYGPDLEDISRFMRPLASFKFCLHMRSIRHYYLERLYFELCGLDTGYDEYKPLFSCRRFEARLVEIFE